MDRDEALQKLSDCRAECEQRFGIKSMAIFGSVARGEARPDSYVDIVVEFRGRPSFDKYMDLKFFLEDLLASPIDLVTPAAIRPAMRERVKSEAVYVA